jgi:hypothetical protein|tara:strand:+ start:589 stop:774 length:186 start_codon:yes stop_codon:yes gene_type:complete
VVVEVQVNQGQEVLVELAVVVKVVLGQAMMKPQLQELQTLEAVEAVEITKVQDQIVMVVQE